MEANRKREEKRERKRKDTERWLLHNEPAATRGNRNNYAKTERNGASRAKEKKEDVPWDGEHKRSKPT
ncbi:transcriptional adapter 2-alpha-like protein [Lasius niger]|uniref:Transcriptional adapter 2-alpha-like protein n=1 Tax=Lasius niger TaxID=67767 RepID=A0A0J7N9H7_LASNI|nr:transcriptional adapter 2-alpha-like protein [Lasius niger]